MSGGSFYYLYHKDLGEMLSGGGETYREMIVAAQKVDAGDFAAQMMKQRGETRLTRVEE